ncbi:MAG: tight adherence protein [Thermoanaerobacter sp.]|jgi:tight adherence protein B|nr:tight adherence protein [Thermoanaerobacter sp.]
MYYSLMVGAGTFLCVLLTVVATVLMQNRERNLQFMIVTGRDEVPVKKREKGPKPEFLVRLEHLARGAGWQLGGVEVLLIMLFCGGAGFALLMALFHHAGVAWVAVPVGMYVPVFYMKERARKRGFDMVLQLADVLTRMGNLLRSGATLAQAVTACADGVAEPLGPVLRRIRDGIQRNRPAVRALEEAIPDIPLAEYKTVCVVADIHTQLGGDMAASFDDIATTLKDVHAMQENLNTQTSAMRLSGIIVGIVPFGVVVALQIVSRGTYFNDFLKTISGQVAVILSLLSILFGWWRIYKMAEFKMN